MATTYKFSDGKTADDAAGNIFTTLQNARDRDMHCGFANINGHGHQGYVVYTQTPFTKEEILAEALPYRQLVGYFEYDQTKEPATITKYDLNEIVPGSVPAQVIGNYVELRDNHDLVPAAKKTFYETVFQKNIREFLGKEMRQL